MGPPSTLSLWLPLSSMVLHPPLLRIPPRLPRPVLLTLLLLRLPRLTGRSAVLTPSLPSSTATPPCCPPPLPLCTTPLSFVLPMELELDTDTLQRISRSWIRSWPERFLLLRGECNTALILLCDEH